MLDDDLLHCMALLKILAFPLFDTVVGTLQQIVFLALGRNLEHVPVGDDVVHFVLEVPVEDSTRRTVLLAWIREVDTVRNDIRAVASDVVIISHSQPLCERKLVNFLPNLCLFHWLIIELSRVLQAYVFDFSEETWLVDVPLFQIRRRSYTITTITTIYGIAFDVVGTRDEIFRRVMESCIEFDLLASFSIVKNVAVQWAALGLVNISLINVMLKTNLSLQAIP